MRTTRERLHPGRWNGDQDNSLIELFGQAQLVRGAVVLLAAAVAKRSTVLAVWGLIFAVIA